MTVADGQITVGELAARYPQTRRVLERFGLDYCCGGVRPLREAAADKGVDMEELTAALDHAVEATPDAGPEPQWLDAALTELADHIEARHHRFMKENLPRLDALSKKVLDVHGGRHGDVLQPLRKTFLALKTEIEEHLWKEERILFPYIRQIDAYAQGRGPKPVAHCGTIQNPIRQMRFEHDNAGAALERMRTLTGDYAVPADGCESFAALYAGLAALEDDLHQHIHLENNILFPRAVELEQKLGLAQCSNGGSCS